MKKKLLSLLLAGMMVIGMMPVMASADETSYTGGTLMADGSAPEDVSLYSAWLQDCNSSVPNNALATEYKVSLDEDSPEEGVTHVNISANKVMPQHYITISNYGDMARDTSGYWLGVALVPTAGAETASFTWGDSKEAVSSGEYQFATQTLDGALYYSETVSEADGNKVYQAPASAAPNSYTLAQQYGESNAKALAFYADVPAGKSINRWLKISWGDSEEAQIYQFTYTATELGNVTVQEGNVSQTLDGQKLSDYTVTPDNETHVITIKAANPDKALSKIALNFTTDAGAKRTLAMYESGGKYIADGTDAYAVGNFVRVGNQDYEIKTEPAITGTISHVSSSDIYTGNLHDTAGLVSDTQVVSGYTATVGDYDAAQNVTQVSVHANSLTKHQNNNSPKGVGYCIGVAFTPKEAITANKVSYVFSETFDGLKEAEKETWEQNVHGTQGGIAFYTNLSEETKSAELWVKLTWKNDSTPVSDSEYYHITFAADALKETTINAVTVKESDEVSSTMAAIVEGHTITLNGVAPGSETTYSLEYTTDAGGKGSTEVKVSEEGEITSGSSFTMLDQTYTVKAEFLPAEVNVAPAGETTVDSAEGVEEDVLTAVKETTADLSAATVQAATSVANDKNVADEATAALKEASVTVEESDTVTVYVEPYLNIYAQTYTAPAEGVAGSMVLNITPMYRTIASTAKTADAIELEGTEPGTPKNAVVMQENQPFASTQWQPIEMTIQLPAGFVKSTSDKVYVNHKGYSYGTTVSDTKGIEPYVITFTNPHGFSVFEVTTEGPVASIGDTQYATLQAAVNDVANGGTITLLEDVTTKTDVTVSDSKTFTLEPGNKVVLEKIGENLTVNGKNVTLSDGKVVVEVGSTGGGTTGGGSTGGGSSSGETYDNTVAATTNGKVTVTDAKKGETATITTTADKGYKVGTVTVKDEKGNTVSVTNAGSGKYTFTQPEGKVTVTVTFVWDNPFKDVKSSDWWYDAVQYVNLNGLMAGTGSNTFEPTATLTRAQAVQVLYNLEGQPAVTGKNTFTDVASNHWGVKAITWASANGVVAGVGNNEFDPDVNVSREQFAQMMYNYATYKKYNTSASADLTKFPDEGSVSTWAEKALAWANAEGLINGSEDGGVSYLAPAGTATRGQTASILMNFDKNIAE